MSEIPEITPQIELIEWEISAGEVSDATGTLTSEGNFLRAQYLLEGKQGEVFEVPTKLPHDASSADVISAIRAHLGY